jgi:hypothetical protein
MAMETTNYPQTLTHQPITKCCIKFQSRATQISLLHRNIHISALPGAVEVIVKEIQWKGRAYAKENTQVSDE